ncbi:MAG: serine/threonine-protein kinase, partial [Gammaproteobacteria bacterium]
MADFKTTLERLSRQEIEFEHVAANIDKLLKRKPQAAVAVMDQLREAVTEDVIDEDTYARLKARVAGHLEAPVGASDDEERTVFASEDEDVSDVFDITGGIGGEDATQILDGTVAAQPMTGDSTGVDIDLTSGSSWPGAGTDTGRTGADWSQPGGDAAAATKLGPGGVLRGRFQLDEVLGVGGMGSVYLGSDLIKVRAKDKQPRVALKVLNEDFKQHPDSFIALQREASRQQKLAHPNIATVYDFDQTEDGLAFLVMELLEGQALNDFIKKVVKPKGGLPFEEAFPMVEGLGNALVYAHERNIVHSDFKPGNCFITKDGAMKVLDFGIARAVKAPGAAEGETTIFDPGKLGALTPAYASVEMLEGEEPDPRDDIYALACVAYELLTGKHPFNKIPANKARDSGLAPEPIKTLTRRQWRGLERGLAFERDNRSQSTAEFLEEFEGATSPFKNPFIVGPAVAALLALGGFFPLKNYLEEQDLLERIAAAQSGDFAQIETVLENLDSDVAAADLDEAQRDRVLTAAKNQILDYFATSAKALIDTDNGRYDFAGARRILDQARAYAIYRDSSVLADLGETIDETENRLFAEQFDRFNLALEEGNLIETPGENDIFDAMQVVRQVNPEHPMLTDRRIPGAFADAINDAIDNEDFEYADELSSVGLSLIPDSTNLVNLSDKVAGARDRAETTATILRAIADIQAAQDSGAGLIAYVGVADAVADLARVDPGNALLEELRASIAPAAEKDVAALEASRRWSDSALMAGDFNTLLRSLGLHGLNARASALGDEFDGVFGEARTAVTAAVAAGELETAAREALDRLADLSPRNPRTTNARNQLARAHLRAAQRARATAD